MKQLSYIGKNAIYKLEKILKKEKPKKIFLVRGKKSYEICGAGNILKPILKKYKVKEFLGFSVNPRIEDIESGISEYKKINPDIVIAVGGGSVIDMAKAINMLAVQKGAPVEYISKKKELVHFGKKIIAIPTTAGTGSEATSFAVVYIGKNKYSLKHNEILPNYALIDPQFTYNLPPKITAETGMDAFCQAIESYWGINSTAESKKYAKRAIELIINNLKKCVDNLDINSRRAMSLAAYLAGKAINITSTTACHAISYPITSYFGVPHGQAVAVTLGSMLMFNGQVKKDDVLDKRGAEYVKKTINELLKILKAKNANEANKIIEKLIKSVGLEIKLNKLGINKKDIEIIIKNGFNPERVKNNPRQLTKKTLKKILIDIL